MSRHRPTKSHQDRHHSVAPAELTEALPVQARLGTLKDLIARCGFTSDNLVRRHTSLVSCRSHFGLPPKSNVPRILNRASKYRS
jgi:hypothetical protein